MDVHTLPYKHTHTNGQYVESKPSQYLNTTPREKLNTNNISNKQFQQETKHITIHVSSAKQRTSDYATIICFNYGFHINSSLAINEN
ncbi:Hypothetical predicted protein [Octopus vulgaris]|uniref:Uncharacterized protein n=1 Tax=Octopus vulgaris TaxID=6645 RepID=A0AA36FES7_OCTVU|nr:Hypothetical predicted protein [Octopus vulgaris]